MDRGERAAALKGDIKTLKAEEKRLLGLIALTSPTPELENRLQAVIGMLEVLSDRLFDLEQGGLV